MKPNPKSSFLVVMAMLAIGCAFSAYRVYKLADRVSLLERRLAGLVVLQANDLTVDIDKNGRISVQGVGVSLQELIALASGIPDKSQRGVVLIVSRETNVERLKSVMNSIRGLGFMSFRVRSAQQG